MKSLETKILELLGENPDAPDVFADSESGLAQIRDSVNDAVEEICLLTGGVKRAYQLALKTGGMFYRLRFTRDSFGWVADAWLPGYNRRLEQTDIFRLNKFNPRWMQNVGTPEAYFPAAQDVLGFWPAPGGSDLIVELTCVILPARYAAEADRIKLRESWQDAAAHYALAEFHASRGNAGQAAHDLKAYLDFLGTVTGYPLAADRRRGLRTEKDPWPRATG